MGFGVQASLTAQIGSFVIKGGLDVKHLKWTCIALFFVFAVIAISTPVSADGQYVTGKEWTESKKSEKLSYLMGISNLMSADYMLQKKSGRAGGSAIPELYRETANISIEQAMDLIDAWYAANPDEMNETVLDVIWVTIVER